MLGAFKIRLKEKQCSYFVKILVLAVFFFFLQETHSVITDTPFWSSQWGDKMLFSHGSSHSAGTAILFNNCPGKIVSSRSDPSGHWLAVVLDIEHIFFSFWLMFMATIMLN